MNRVVTLMVCWVCCVTVCHADAIDFNRDIRPILSENCYLCHGPDKNHRKGKLRLDDRSAAIAKQAIVPNKSNESEMITRLHASDPKDQMPPSSSQKKLTETQKKLLARWIDEGAEYQAHWAYIPPKKTPLPEVKKSGVTTPIDRYIVHALEASKITPSPEADRRTLLRRLSLDLTGLPPTPNEIEVFVNDRDPKAYEKQVDRLLASPHYGERMAAPWLDVVRYSDTVGYHGDQNQNIFPYRDYVINAFNSNMPFDRFTREQLAGDLLPNPTPAQITATGYHRLNMMTREGGAQPKEYMAKYTADRVRTFAMTWLGTTLGCCECHDHKYDPFAMKDFYSLAAFFADIKQWGVYMDYGYTPNPELRGYSNDHPFPPEIEVDSPYLQQRQAKLHKQIRQLAKSCVNQPSFDAWRKKSVEFLKGEPTGWETPKIESHDLVTSVQADGNIHITAAPKKGDEHLFVLKPRPGRVASLRLDLLPDSKNKTITRDKSDSTTVQLSVALHSAKKKQETKLGFFHADTEYFVPRYANGYAKIGILEGWTTRPEDNSKPLSSVWILNQPTVLAEGDWLVVTLKSSNVASVRLLISPFVAVNPRELHLAQLLATALSNPEPNELLGETYLLSAGQEAEKLEQARKLMHEIYACRFGRATTMVTQAREPSVVRILPRGNWQDESGEITPPAVPKSLPQIPVMGRRLTRLDLANWLVTPENPLTSRVFVNRLWKQFFGTGFSSVLEDVGAQGEWPTHPELLDWLAVDFRESGWDIKRLVKQIVMSSTYRQDSRIRPKMREIDPNNRLLASQMPRRLDAEFIRDNALAIAGLLNREIGGPSVRPYQPAGYYVNLQFPNRDYLPHSDERQYRRGLYMHWQRTFLHPMLANFDAPAREECIANRTVANTPQQALTLLNDPTFVEASRVLAQHLFASAKNDGDRLEILYQRALARSPRVDEKASLLEYLESQRTHYLAHTDEARKLVHVGLAPVATTLPEPDLAAWTHVCRVVMNLHETVTRY